MAEAYTSTITRRAKVALKLGALVLGISTLVYYIGGCLCGMNAGYGKSLWSLADDRWELSECLYFSSITLTTTGYTDLLGTERVELYQDGNGNFRWDSETDAHTSSGDYDPESEELYFNFSPLTRTLTTVIGIFGMAFFLFVIAQITAFFVEGGYEAMAVNRRRKKKLSRLRDHVIVCGGGSEGSHAVEHILKSGVDCAVIDTEESAIQEIQSRHNRVACLRGDATLDETLQHAGLERARAVICALPDDGLNLVTIVTVRQHRDDIRIASRAESYESAGRLKLAGADEVVNSSRLLGLRLASHLIRPAAVDFIDHVLGHTGSQDLQLVSIPLHEEHVGNTLGHLTLDETANTTLVAVRHATGQFTYNPPMSDQISADDHLLVVGQPNANAALAARLGSSVLHDDPLVTPGDGTAVDSKSIVENHSIDGDSGHYIVCGANNISAHILREMAESGRSAAMIDRDLEPVRELGGQFPSLRMLEGDARTAELLDEAELSRARGLVSTFRSDRDNLIVVVTALQLSPNLRVVSLASDDSSAGRLEHAGAVVRQIGKIGGRRLASQLLKTAATGLLDRMLDESGSIRFESVAVRANSRGANRKLGELDVFGQTGLRILALRRPGETTFVVAPAPEELLVLDCVLVVAGQSRQVNQLAELVGEWE